MSRRRVLLAGMVVAGLAVSGVGVASALMDLPQDAVPVSQDPVGDALRDTARAPLQTPPTAAPAQPSPPAASPGPTAAPTTSTPAAPLIVIEGQEVAGVQEEAPEEVQEEAKPAPAVPSAVPGRRQRRPVAVIHAIDKTTAESMRFEVEVGGRPVRFSKTLIFNVRACEISASDELTEDAIAYLEVGIKPRGVAVPTEARQIFKGWMFASSPAVSGLQHPIYDAWVVGCKA